MKHVTFAVVKIATVMEIVPTTKMIIPVCVHQNTLEETANSKTTAIVTRAHMETVQIMLDMAFNVLVKADTRVMPVM